MEGEVKGLRALGFACLILSATVAAPALSTAQDPGSPQEPSPAPPGGASASPAPASEPPGGASASPAPASRPGIPAGEAEEMPVDGEAVNSADDIAQAEPPPAAAAAPAAAPAPPKLAKAAAATVSVGDNFFAPTSVTIFAGETVTWRNDGQAQHSATANNGSFDTGIFGPGQSRSESFSSAGSFAYYCVVHGLSQSGTVEVTAATGGGGGGGGGVAGGSGSAGSGSSEAAAVASPSAAGTSASLPATGFAAAGLAFVGLVLLASGIAVGRAAPGRSEESQRHLFSIY